jgi:hypothetical protein
MRKALPGIFGLAVVALLGWLMFTAKGPDRALDRSVMGADGLEIWLRANDMPVTRANRRLTHRREDLSAMIVPLYDTNLRDQAAAPTDDAARMANPDPRDMQGWMMEVSADLLPTLVVLPKWRQGFALTGIAHEQTQVPPAALREVLQNLDLKGARVLPVENRVTTARVAVSPAAPRAQDIALFRAQLLDVLSLPSRCSPLVVIGDGALLIDCRETDDIPALRILTDPDVLNNHGLRLADNAGFALDVVRDLTAGDARPVLLATESVLVSDDEGPPEPHERSAEDLSRFFAWPLSALWLMGGAVLGLALWRGARRFGPAHGPAQDAAASSRRAAIAAKARLLRLSGADARMAAEHARAHLADMAVQALGPGSGNEAGVARWLALLARSNPDLARDLHDAGQIPPDTPSAELPRRLAALYALTRKAQHAA